MMSIFSVPITRATSFVVVGEVWKTYTLKMVLLAADVVQPFLSGSAAQG